MITNCPRCGKSVANLIEVSPAVLEKLRREGIPTQPLACDTCIAELSASTGHGSVLLARQKAKEQKKLMLWKSRVNLIKRARQYMTEKKFPDAAVAYEKYLKVLELVFDVKSMELKPEMFKESARTTELTVVASVYWDLLRIYDSSSKYKDRQAMISKKLSEFLRFTPLYPDVIKKAEAFQKTAKNPEAIKNFLKMSSDNRGRCFIATSAFESYMAPEVQYLSHFRDENLLPYKLGQTFVKYYYRYSPKFADILDQHPRVKPLVRLILRQIIRLISVFTCK